MNNFYKDIFIGAVFVLGLISFILRKFIIASTLIAAAISSNVNSSRKQSNTVHFSFD
jgi:hypothetical protein